MPLRPIDVIFTDPKERYYVVYQDGVLHQLTRMKLDMKSWERRTPFTGNIETIVVSPNQYIQDPQLRNILNTQNLPESLYGRNLPFFEGWWETNGYDWSQQTQAKAKLNATEGNQKQKSVTTTSVDTTSPALNSSNQLTSSQPHNSENLKNSAHVTQSSTDKSAIESNAVHGDLKTTQKNNARVDDDFFDNLLSELNR